MQSIRELKFDDEDFEDDDDDFDDDEGDDSEDDSYWLISLKYS